MTACVRLCDGHVPTQYHVCECECVDALLYGGRFVRKSGKYNFVPKTYIKAAQGKWQYHMAAPQVRLEP